ncbi:MAG: gliding motility-associated ABC transporter substrate-binding protein GldG [Cytophagales bacterium]|nr:MAG: gliding motility-associated ABC transporter substrate-binding protein GldG [Cytophagales bacterium]
MKKKNKDILIFLLTLLLLIATNYLANFYYTRLDLTEEKRYTISNATVKLLESLDDEIYIKIYLEGQLPAGFKRLRNAIQETLDEFQRYAGKKIKYKFIDPSIAKSNKERGEFYQSLVKKGIIPNNVVAKEGDQKVEKVIFPGALLYYKNLEIPLMLFKVINQKVTGAPSPEQILNQSVENVEYNIASAIRKLTLKKENKKNIAFSEGHGEASNLEIADLLNSLGATYNVFKVNLKKETKLTGLDALIIVKPDSSFNQDDKYKLDQYVMNGGKILFFVDANGVYMDSVLRDKGSFTFPYNHNLTDLLFKYGVRLAPNLIKDLNSAYIPMVTGNLGEEQRIQPIPWQYYPLINTFAKHPIVKNLDAITTKFVGVLDSVKAEGIKKTPLLFSSKYTMLRGTPAFVTFNEARQQPDPKLYNKSFQPIAYLLEGQFTSMFKSRILPNDPRAKNFKDKSPDTKILVCADADIAINEIVLDKKTQNPMPLPLGFDRLAQATFSNKDFIVNALDYMLEENGIIAARRKEIALRPLDRIKITQEQTQWQVLNLGLPPLLIVLFGFVWFTLRKRLFS